MLKIKNPIERQIPKVEMQVTIKNVFNETFCILITFLILSTGGLPPEIC